MKHFRKLMLIALSFGIVMLALSLVPSKPAGAAGSAPVTVTNTPLPVQGTVGAAQSGAWNVGITGGAVNVVNSESSPVLTRDIDKGARQPLQKLLCVGTGSSTGLCGPVGNVFVVPDEKRLVIEQVSGKCDQEQGTVVVNVSITTKVGSDQVDHAFPLQLPATFAAPIGEYASSFHDVTRIYADSGTTVSFLGVQFLGPTGRDALCRMGVSGHLVDQ